LSWDPLIPCIERIPELEAAIMSIVLPKETFHDTEVLIQNVDFKYYGDHHLLANPAKTSAPSMVNKLSKGKNLAFKITGFSS
jgi:hypothetical protein